MREWIEAQLAAGLPGFAGSAVTGTLAVKQEVLTELLAQWLADTTRGAGGTTAPFDVGRVTPLIKSASVRAEPGRVLVDFTIAV